MSDNERNRGCVGKTRHITYDMAKRELNKKKRNNNKSLGHIIDVYRCKFCAGFHIGHQQESRRN